MIEWTNSDREFASKYGCDCVSETIDEFNGIKDPVKMIDYLLETPDGWACPRWEALPATRFDGVLKTILEAMVREKKCQYQYAARYFYPSGIIATDHIFDNPTDAKCFSGSIDGVKKVICRREVGEWEEVK